MTISWNTNESTLCVVSILPCANGHISTSTFLCQAANWLLSNGPTGFCQVFFHDGGIAKLRVFSLHICLGISVVLGIFYKLLLLFHKVGVCTSVVHVNGLGLTVRVSVNPIMKFIYTLCKCKCIEFIYIRVSVKINLFVLFYIVQ
jgi:hypothetical protein